MERASQPTNDNDTERMPQHRPNGLLCKALLLFGRFSESHPLAVGRQGVVWMEGGECAGALEGGEGRWKDLGLVEVMPTVGISCSVR